MSETNMMGRMRKLAVFSVLLAFSIFAAGCDGGALMAGMGGFGSMMMGAMTT